MFVVHACVQKETDGERKTETDRDRHTTAGGAEELLLWVIGIAELVRLELRAWSIGFGAWNLGLGAWSLGLGEGFID